MNKKFIALLSALLLGVAPLSNAAIFDKRVDIDEQGITFDGATANSYKTRVAVTDPTASRTQTLPDVSGTIEIKTAASAITPAATISLTPAKTSMFTLTPGEDETINAVVTGAVVSKLYVLKVLTSGETSRTITFGTNFKTTGTLATGTSDAKIFILTFVFDGTSFVEVSRTTAI